MNKFEVSYNNLQSSFLIILDGKYSNCIKSYMISDGMSLEATTNIFQNAAKILNYCPNPENNRVEQSTGIVIGKVQSGKTSNFIALTALAFDNKYNLIIILGGTTKQLLKQNYDRICEYYKSIEEEVYIFDSVNYINNLSQGIIHKHIRNNKKIIIVALKHQNTINTITRQMFINSVLIEQPILVIDDEGDQASLNTLVKKNKKSAVYKSIENLKTKLNKHCFISVTATPQANILISAVDIISPSFGVIVEPGLGYCGLDIFHDGNNKYIRQIPDNEESLLDSIGINESFMEALAVFFVSSAIRKLRGMTAKDKHAMLIHPSHIKDDHKQINKKVNRLVEEWKTISQTPEDISITSLRETLKSAYWIFINRKLVLPDYNLLEPLIFKVLQDCELHVINSDKIINDGDKFNQFNIYIGGNMLGRGITLKGLAITYIIRSSKSISNVDTVQQRARWFGYKQNVLDLCMVYATNKIVKEFEDIRLHENDLWDTIKIAEKNGVSFSEFPKLFILDKKLRMTRTSVASAENFNFPFWNNQIFIQQDIQFAQNNENIISHFMNDHSKDLKDLKFGNTEAHRVLYHLPFKLVKENLLDKFIFPSQSKLNNNLISKIDSLLTSVNINTVINIVWMRYNTGELRSVNNGKISSDLMQGYSPKEGPRIYPGDRNIIDEPIMMLQIHDVIDREDKSKKRHPTLALYLPFEYISKLAGVSLVIKDGDY